MQFADRLEVLCDQGPFPAAGQIDCAAISVGGRYSREAVRAYVETGVTVQTLIDWPSGLGKPTVRQIEAVAAAKDGTRSIDLMGYPGHVIGPEYGALRDDLMAVVIAVREVSRDVVVNVVVDTAWLSQDAQHVEAVCLAVRESGGDGIVVGASTSATPEIARQTVAQVCEYAGPLRVKVVSPSASAEVLEDWLLCGVDRVVVPSGILFG